MDVKTVDAKTLTAEHIPVAKKRARRMSPAERHQQILSCAIATFAEKGIANCTHADVAEAADVSIPTVFHYFSTIDALQEAVLMEVHRFLLEGFVKSRMTQQKPSYEKIEDMLLEFREAIDTHTDYVTIWLEWSGFRRGFIGEMYLTFYKEVVSAIRKLLLQGRKDNSISDDINASDAARIILGMAHTIAHMRFAGSSHKTVQHTIHSLVMSYIGPRNRRVSD